MSQEEIQYLKRDGHPTLAYIYSPAGEAGQNLPTVMFCGGFRSDMMGTKATYFELQCRARGQAYLRFDYSGHGDSDGAFQDGTIGSWYQDALAIFDAVVNGPVIIVGSSMGGWIGLLLSEARAAHVKGFIGIAAAPDFTMRVYAEEFDDEQRKAVEEEGFVEIPNEYSDEPYIFTKALFEDGKKNIVLNKNYTHAYPITLFHGLRDTAVPKETPLAIRDHYQGGSLDIVFIEDGDHSLSREDDLKAIEAEILAMSNPEAF